MIYQLKISAGTILFLMLLGFISSCTFNDDLDTQEDELAETIEEEEKTLTYPLADEALWSYFESFEKEAQIRGLNYDLDALEITGVIEEISDEGVAGTCQYGQHIHHVTVDKTFWNNSSNLRRELVVYHELGHCVLFKDHTENYNNEGICLSMMNSGTAPCSVAYNSQNREYYIDELFANLD